MSEKLIIKNLGPISTVELDLRRVNVLIGDQGTGKSTVAKLLDILKNVSNLNSGELHLSINSKQIKDEVEIAESKNDKFKNDFFNAIEGSDIKNYLNEKTYIYFENSCCKIVVDEFEILFKDKTSNKEKNTNLNYYIPAFREAYILLRNNYPAILNAKANLPAILNSFGQHFNNYREDLKYFNFQKIIGVDYVYNNAREFIVLKDGKEISFEESSSAINSVVPMLVVFSGVVQNMSVENPRIYHYHNCPFVTIEEPELNCFPSTQNELVKFLIEKIKFKDYQKSKDYYCNLLITTHSPYILTSLNNLMFAYQAGNNYESEINKIVDKKYWINPADVSAYMMLPNGQCESILDREGLIKTEKIDGISGVLNKEFNEMFDIELAIKK